MPTPASELPTSVSDRSDNGDGRRLYIAVEPRRHALQVDRILGTALRIAVLRLSCHGPLSNCLVTNTGPVCIGNLGRACAEVLWRGQACSQLVLFCTRAVYAKSTTPVD